MRQSLKWLLKEYGVRDWKSVQRTAGNMLQWNVHCWTKWMTKCRNYFKTFRKSNSTVVSNMRWRWRCDLGVVSSRRKSDATFSDGCWNLLKSLARFINLRWISLSWKRPKFIHFMLRNKWLCASEMSCFFRIHLLKIGCGSQQLASELPSRSRKIKQYITNEIKADRKENRRQESTPEVIEPVMLAIKKEQVFNNRIKSVESESFRESSLKIWFRSSG